MEATSSDRPLARCAGGLAAGGLDAAGVAGPGASASAGEAVSPSDRRLSSQAVRGVWPGLRVAPGGGRKGEADTEAACIARREEEAGEASEEAGSVMSGAAEKAEGGRVRPEVAATAAGPRADAARVVAVAAGGGARAAAREEEEASIARAMATGPPRPRWGGVPPTERRPAKEAEARREPSPQGREEPPALEEAS